jgi:hypothetical protein
MQTDDNDQVMGQDGGVSPQTLETPAPVAPVTPNDSSESDGDVQTVPESGYAEPVPVVQPQPVDDSNNELAESLVGGSLSETETVGDDVKTEEYASGPDAVAQETSDGNASSEGTANAETVNTGNQATAVELPKEDAGQMFSQQQPEKPKSLIMIIVAAVVVVVGCIVAFLIFKPSSNNDDPAPTSTPHVEVKPVDYVLETYEGVTNETIDKRIIDSELGYNIKVGRVLSGIPLVRLAAEGTEDEPMPVDSDAIGVAVELTITNSSSYTDGIVSVGSFSLITDGVATKHDTSLFTELIKSSKLFVMKDVNRTDTITAWLFFESTKEPTNLAVRYTRNKKDVTVTNNSGKEETITIPAKIFDVVLKGTSVHDVSNV